MTGELPGPSRLAAQVVFPGVWCRRMGSTLPVFRFQTLLGILIGNSASPTLEVLYMVNLPLPVHAAGVCLAGVRVFHLEQADVVIIFFSASLGALQCTAR